jgi:cell division protein FtsN
MDDNIIKSSYDKKYVPKKLDDKVEDVVEDKPKTTAKKTTTKKTTSTTKTSTTSKSTKEEKAPSQVAVYSDGKLSHPALGRLTKGYNIVSKEQADEWMKVSTKVRLATPEEVASAYEV